MLNIEPPDSHFLLAASGWLDLGNPVEADAELERINPGLREHPDVLKIGWSIRALAKDWEGALTVANVIKDRLPNDPFGWIHSAYALHELKKTAEAFNILVAAEDRFPACETIPYNLACYTAQMGDLPQARVWLHKAISLGGPEEVKARALSDPDLEPLRAEIRNL